MTSMPTDMFLRKGIKKILRQGDNFLKTLGFIKKNFYCEALFLGKQAAILSDGTVVCSCFDGIKDVVLGSLRQNTLFEIWHGKRTQQLRDSFRKGILPSYICTTCPFFVMKNSKSSFEHIQKFPSVVFVENDARCNLNCLSCDRTRIIKSRQSLKMDSTLFKQVIDELYSYKEFEKLCFVGHGESFISDEAYEFISYAKSKNISIPVIASTNGLALDSDKKREAFLLSGLDRAEFSINGASRESYMQYHRGGDFDKVIYNLKRLIAIKKEKGLDKPYIVWKYILFRWNDNDENIERAISLSREIGVDKFRFSLTHSPITGFSKKYMSFRKKYYNKIESYL